MKLFVALNVFLIFTVSLFLNQDTVRLPSSLEEQKSCLHSLETILKTSDEILPLKGSLNIQSKIFELVRSAKESVLIESGNLKGEEIFSLVKEKVAQGVEVKILVADPGKQFRGKARASRSEKVYQELRDAGAKVYYYPQDKLKRRSDLPGLELHRKLVVVDSDKAYLGSVNIGSTRDNFDLGVILSEREEVLELKRIFNEDLFVASRGRDYDLDALSHLSNSKLKYLNGRATKRELIHQIENSQKQITMIAYEISDPRVVRALVEKKKSNPEMDIKILVGPMEKAYKFKGVGFTIFKSVEQIEKLRKAGIEVLSTSDPLLAKKGIYHGKASVFDNEKVILGSTDFTRRGFQGNLELSVLIENKDVAKVFADYLNEETTIANSLRIFSKKEKLFSTLFEVVIVIVEKVNGVKRTLKKLIPSSAAQVNLYTRKVRGLIVQSIWGNILKATKLYDDLIKVDTVLLKMGKEYHFEIKGTEEVNELRDGAKFLFAGYNSFSDLKNRHLKNAGQNKGFWGVGHYVANHPRTAVEYALMRSHQMKNPNSVLYVYQITDSKILNYNEFKSQIDEWGLSKGIVDESIRIKEYCLEKGYGGIVVPGAEGPRHDYYVIYDDSAIELQKRINFQVQER